MWDIFKVDNKDIRMTSVTSFDDFVAYFEHISHFFPVIVLFILSIYLFF